MMRYAESIAIQNERKATKEYLTTKADYQAIKAYKKKKKEKRNERKLRGA